MGSGSKLGWLLPYRAHKPSTYVLEKELCLAYTCTDGAYGGNFFADDGQLSVNNDTLDEIHTLGGNDDANEHHSMRFLT